MIIENFTKSKKCIILKNQNVQIFSVDNFLNNQYKQEILDDCKKYLKLNSFNQLDFPQEQSDSYLINNHLHKNSWIKLIEMISILKSSFYKEYYKTNYVPEMKLKKSWVVSINKKNLSPNYWHTHEAIISGIYYLQSPNPRIQTLFKCDDGSIVTVSSKPNRLILFPSQILHTPDSNSFNSNKERITLSFDICLD